MHTSMMLGGKVEEHSHIADESWHEMYWKSVLHNPYEQSRAYDAAPLSAVFPCQPQLASDSSCEAVPYRGFDWSWS